MYKHIKSISESKKQIIKFGLIGFLAFFVDMGVYVSFTRLFSDFISDELFRNSLSKGLSFMCGTFVTYNLNKIWTWRKRDRDHKRFVKFLALYGSSMLINVASNALYYSLLPIDDSGLRFKAAVIGATITSAFLNFLGQKIWVFKMGKDDLEDDSTES